MRFFSAFRALPPALLDQLMRTDSQRIALIASATPTAGQPEILAVGRAYAAGAGSAELSLLVRSDLKGRGLGSLLLNRLIVRCRRHGLRRLFADVLQVNTRMLCLADKFGFRREGTSLDVARLVLSLD